MILKIKKYYNSLGTLYYEGNLFEKLNFKYREHHKYETIKYRTLNIYNVWGVELLDYAFSHGSGWNREN